MLPIVPVANIAADNLTNVVFHNSGLVTVIKIVATALMKWIVLPLNVNLACSNVETIRLAFQEFESVMAFRIVVIRAMNRSVTVIVDNIASSVKAREDVFRIHGNVTVSFEFFCFCLVFKDFILVFIL